MNKTTKLYENYLRTIEWNKEFGALCNTSPVKKLDKQIIEYRCSIIQEEVNELLEGIKQKDIVEIWDALCDILVTVYGALSTIGYPLDLVDKSVKLYETIYVNEHEKPSLSLFIDDEECYAKIKKYGNMMNYIMKQLKNVMFENDFELSAKMLNYMARISLSCCYIAKLNPDEGMKVVNDSNFQKACKTEKEAIESAESYKNGKRNKTFPEATYRKSTSGKFFIVYDAKSLKILKSINWKEPDFNDLIQDEQ